MYNINMYSYMGEPYSKEKLFTIHPLNNPGFEKYTGPDSHNANYVSQINPKVFKQIVGVDYDTLVAQQKEILKNKPIIPPPSPQPQLNPEDDFKPPIHENTLQPNNQQTQNPAMSTRTLNNKEGILSKEIHSFPMKNQRALSTFRNNSANDIFNHTNQFFHKKRNFKEMYGYDNTSQIKTAKQKYMYQINQLKQGGLKDGDFNASHSNSFYPKKRYKGFTAYMVPRTDYTTPSSPRGGAQKAFDTYNKMLQRSLSCCVIDNPNNNQNEYEKLKSSNEQMKNNLLYQTNPRFLARNKLPDVTQIALTRQVIRKVNNGNHKLLSEKYNPYALVTPNKNRYAVNYCGALFQH